MPAVVATDLPSTSSSYLETNALGVLADQPTVIADLV